MHDAATEIGWDSRDIFRNKIFCADCGSVMIGMKGCARKGGKAKSWIYYDCNSYRESQRLLCSCHYINQNTVMSVLKNAIDKQLQIAVNAERLISDITAHRITLPFYTDAEKKQSPRISPDSGGFRLYLSKSCAILLISCGDSRRGETLP